MLNQPPSKVVARVYRALARLYTYPIPNLGTAATYHKALLECLKGCRHAQAAEELAAARVAYGEFLATPGVGELDAAALELRRAAIATVRCLGPVHPRSTLAYLVAGAVTGASGDSDGAAQLLNSALGLLEGRIGPEYTQLRVKAARELKRYNSGGSGSGGGSRAAAAASSGSVNSLD